MRGKRELVEHVIDLHEQLGKNLQAAAAPLWSHLDLSMAQLKALLSIGWAGTPTVGELGDSLGIGRPAASALVDRLVHLGLVERWEDQVDRRRTHAALSQAGRDLIASLRQGGAEALRVCLEVLSTEDLEALARGLSALSEATRQAGVQRRLAEIGPKVLVQS